MHPQWYFRHIPSKGHLLRCTGTSRASLNHAFPTYLNIMGTYVTTLKVPLSCYSFSRAAVGKGGLRISLKHKLGINLSNARITVYSPMYTTSILLSQKILSSGADTHSHEIMNQSFTRTCEKCLRNFTNSVSQQNFQTNIHKHSSHAIRITTCWGPRWISNYHCTLTQNLFHVFIDRRLGAISVANFWDNTTAVRLE